MEESERDNSLWKKMKEGKRDYSFGRKAKEIAIPFGRKWRKAKETVLFPLEEGKRDNFLWKKNEGRHKRQLPLEGKEKRQLRT